ncbi:hypothetical protein FTO70_06015 [Methanosarcina sp. KYL-1]|nr:hypothetical protein [Methanosarcina sp. KYL-1]
MPGRFTPSKRKTVYVWNIIFTSYRQRPAVKRKLSGKERGKTMSEKNSRVKIIRIKDMHIEKLKIKGLGPRPLIIKDLTLKDVRLIIRLPAEKEN